MMPESALSRNGDSSAPFSVMDTNLITSLTASANTYQIHLTRQRINRDPMALGPSRTLGQEDHDQGGGHQDAWSEEACQGIATRLSA
jgi:hypothetical protein